jgi:methyl coenzyme M reductase gamma subunit
VGRALGMAGFGIDVSVASAEEVINAINNQNNKKMVESVQTKPIDEIKIKIINDAVGKIITADQLKKTLAHYKVDSIAELNEAQACEVINRIKELKGE